MYFLTIVAYAGSCLLAAHYNTLLNTYTHYDLNSSVITVLRKLM